MFIGKESWFGTSRLRCWCLWDIPAAIRAIAHMGCMPAGEDTGALLSILASREQLRGSAAVIVSYVIVS